MATQFINQALSNATVDGQLVNFQSNEVTADLFDNTSITLVKTQSTDLVVSGGTMTYTIVVTNLAASDIANVDFTDSIPAGMTFTAGTFKVNGTVEVPTVVGQDLSYLIATLPTGATNITFDCTVA